MEAVNIEIVAVTNQDSFFNHSVSVLNVFLLLLDVHHMKKAPVCFGNPERYIYPPPLKVKIHKW